MFRGLSWLFVLVLVSCKTTPPKPAPESAPEYKSAREMPVEVFFKNPAVSYYAVSPDGKNLALLKPWKNRLNVFVHPFGQPQAEKQLTFVEDRDIRQIFWKGPEYVLFMRDFGGDENFHVFSAHVTSGEVKDLTPYQGARASVVDTLEESSPTDIMVQHNQRDKQFFDLYRVNLQTGASQMVAKNENKIDQWIVDHTGQPRAGVATDGVNTVLYYEKNKGKRWAPIFKTGFRNNFEVFAFTADSKKLFGVTNLKGNLNRVVEIDPSQPTSKILGRTLYAHPKFDVSGAEYSIKRKTVGEVSVVTDRPETFFLHPDDQKDYDFLKTKLPGQSLQVVNTTLDEQIWVVLARSDVSRGDYHLYDRATRTTQHLAKVAPWLNPELMSTMKPVSFKARDGLEISGYLTIPKDVEAKNLPVIMHIHGGPWARDMWRFDPESQFLASRGYAVMQVNFRGSTGYGRKHWEASFKQWGRKMQDDISDAVQWLVAQGVADPKRVCIYGGSYGGYATLAGLTFTPDLYACGVDFVGPSNLFTLLETLPPYWESYKQMLYAMVGHPVKDKALLQAASPVFHADRIKAPLFVAQGANDPRVKKAESDQIVEALKKRGVDVEYMLKENEGHGFGNEENRFDFYRAMEKFLAKHLGGRP